MGRPEVVELIEEQKEKKRNKYLKQVQTNEILNFGQ